MKMLPWLACLLSMLTVVNAFRCSYGRNGVHRIQRGSQLSMIFDFIRQRSAEGFAQVQNIAAKSKEGRLLEAFSDSIDYVRQRQKIDSENIQKLFSGILEAFSENTADLDQRLTKLEEVLLQADLGSVTTNTIIEDLRSYAKDNSEVTLDDIAPVMRQRLIEALTIKNVNNGLNFAAPEERMPTVILVIGANGMGKTTTIGKIAARLHLEANATVLVAACDTYRAAAVEQLSEWSRRAQVALLAPAETERSGSPLPVLRRALQEAKDKAYDVLIVDTSGRLTNNFDLTQELIEMKQIITQFNPRAPHETLLVVDGSLGRNAVDQALAWRKHVGVSGLAITKMDGTARGGFVVSVAKDLGIPVKFLGVGEKIDDLRDFNPETFVDALLGNSKDNLEALKARADKIINRQTAKKAFTVGASSSVSASEPNTNNGRDSLAKLRQSFATNTSKGSSKPSGSVIKSKSNSKNTSSNASKKKPGNSGKRK